MKIYFDLVLIINIVFDFLLLITTSIILKRNVKLKRLILGSLIGGSTIFVLFIKINNFQLFLLKIFISIIMVISTFSYKSFKHFINNIIYLYLTSIVLGGFLYLINNEIKYKSYGLVVVKNGYKTNILFLSLFGPLILYFYIRQMKKLKNNYNNYYKVEIIQNNKVYKFTGYLDTGNKLKDPYKKRPVTILYTDKIKFSYESGILVPYTTIKGDGLLKCIIVDKLIINSKKIINKALIGLSDSKFKLDGIDIILNNEIMGG